MGRYTCVGDVIQDLQGNYAPWEWVAVEEEFEEWFQELLEEVWDEGASNYWDVNPYKREAK